MGHALDRIADAVAREEDPERVLHAIAGATAECFDADEVRLARFDHQVCEVVAAVGANSPPLGTRMPITGARAVARVAATGLPARVDDYEVLRRRDAAAREAVPPGLRAGIAAPIAEGGRLWGVMLAATTVSGRRFPQHEEERFALFARHVGMAVTGALARLRLRGVAPRTPTDLPGRRVFDAHLGQAVRAARASGGTVSVVLADVDGFRRVNEELGHGDGDRVLARIARRIAEALPRGTPLAHFGGDEFAWILPGSAAADANRTAEAIARCVLGAPWHRSERLTACIGICDLGAAPLGAPELYRLADVALIEAKQTAPGTVRRYEPAIVEVLGADENTRRPPRHQALAGVRILARAVDARDPLTQRHSERVAWLAAGLALRLGWSEGDVQRLREAALVHDVGKIGVPDHVLLKPGPLSGAERRVMEGHAALGAEIVREVLEPRQIEWVRHHHERPDGRGYPDGVSGEDLSEGARILALADAFDAMTEEREYKAAMPVWRALRECERGAGTQFCPRVVDALRALVGPVDPRSRSEASADSMGAPPWGRACGGVRPSP